MTREKTDAQLLALVRAGLWGEAPRAELFDAATPWPALLHAARRQTVAGVAFAGVERLPAGQRPPREVLLAWYADAQRIAAASRRVDEVLGRVVARYRAAGLTPVLLKGQGVARLYREPQLRQPGDIDLYFGPSCARANAEAAGWEGVALHPATTYHRSFTWQGVTVENHRRYVDFYHPANRRAWAAIAARLPLTDGSVLALPGGGEVAVPSARMNALYLLLHLMHHFLQTGVGLRQVCDWACLLARHGRSLDGATLAADLRALGMLRPAAALARIVVDELGVPAGAVPAELLGAARGADVRLLLGDILASGNFGHDTPQMRGFRRGAHLHNARNYAAALMRHARIFRLCPREVAAYPFVWLKKRRQGDEA